MGSPAARSLGYAYGRGLEWPVSQCVRDLDTGYSSEIARTQAEPGLRLQGRPVTSRRPKMSAGWSVTKPLIGQGLAAPTPAAPGRRLGRTPYRSSTSSAAYRVRHGSGSTQVTHRPLGVTARWRSKSTSAASMLVRAMGKVERRGHGASVDGCRSGRNRIPVTRTCA
jgi:hypothetical protein